MSPLPRLVHLANCADTTASIASKFSGCGDVPESNRRANDPPTLPIDPTLLILTHDKAPQPFKRELSAGEKVGLGMIPAVISLCTVLLIIAIWWRRRRTNLARFPKSPPPVPEKDYPRRGRSDPKSTADSRRDSRVFNMAAFTTPIHYTDKREASIIGQSPTRKSALQRNGREKEAKTVQLAVPSDTYAESDSPVDGQSPFRLKRGDTMKRLSLGTEISKVWPSPPPAAWMRQVHVPDQTVSPL